MANILDIRRRIRSVINTRQITKAMKVVSAAKLRRAQERALAARPYAQMLTNVLKSLVTRAEIYDPETGEPKHPLLAQREEKTILLIESGKERRHRGGGPQRPGFPASPISGGNSPDEEPCRVGGLSRRRAGAHRTSRRHRDHR
jgi:hypothetical protein